MSSFVSCSSSLTIFRRCGAGSSCVCESTVETSVVETVGGVVGSDVCCRAEAEVGDIGVSTVDWR